METKKCKYCCDTPEDFELESFDDKTCPSCAKTRLAISDIVPRKSASVDLAMISPFAKDGDYLEVTEWANQEGFDAELYSVNQGDKPTQNFSLTYDEYEAMVNIVSLLGFKPVFYLDDTNK